METSGKTITRRSFLATTALTAGALATATTANLNSLSPAEAAVEAGNNTEASDAPEESTFINTCRGNCGGSCILQGTVREGKLVKVQPMRFDGEGVTQGCVKGIATPIRTYGTHRLLHPMLQTGERGSDNWEQISWDEAIDLVANAFTTAFDTYGEKSVALWTGSGNIRAYLSGAPFHIDNKAPLIGNYGLGISRFVQKTGVTYMGNTGDQAGLYMRNKVLGVPDHSVEDLQYSDTIIVWGYNPAEASTTRDSWTYICKARENGAKMVVIDPLFTTTAAHADLWIPIRVGTDGALMCAMINYIVENNLQDSDYLANKSIAPLLVKDDGTYLRLSDIGEPPIETTDEEGNVASLDDPVVWDDSNNAFVAQSLASNPAVSVKGMDLEYAVSTVYDLALDNIKPYTLEYASNECGISEDVIKQLIDICLESKATCLGINWGIEHVANCFRIYYAAGLLASLLGNVGFPGAAYTAPQSSASTVFGKPPLLNSEVVIENAKEFNVITGDWSVDIIETGKWNNEDYPLSVLYIQGHDPLDNTCDPLRIVKSWDNLDLVVTADQFMTTTAHYSDLVLPVAVTWEYEDYHTSTGFMYQKAIEPAGEARTDFLIWQDICNKMGYGDLLDKTPEEYLKNLLNTPENTEAGRDYEAFHENGVIFDYQYKETTAVEYNPLGRTQFYVEELLPRDALDITFPIEDRLPGYSKAAESYPDNPERDKYPLFGFFNHEVYHGQSMWAHNAWLDEFRSYEGSPYLRIHEDAAQERNIQTGDLVRAFNSHGEVVIRAVVTKGIQRESVWFPHGFYWDEFEAGFAQSLTGYYLDPQTANGNYNDFLCEVEKYEEGE